jgi:hypothetical protein
MLLVYGFIASLSGCGGGNSVDVSKPVEVTDEMQRQAEASDKFISEQGKSKKSAN